MNNAIKFTEKGSVSLLTETISITEDKIKIRFIVEDTGIGMAQQNQQNVFEPFVQASISTNRNYGGTGLGLPIVKKVLEMFDTNINLSSIPGKGTTFYFDIDFEYQLANSLTSTEAVDVKYELAHLKVLVAEDNPVNILVIKKTLEQWNIVPSIAENGLIALQKLDEGDFDIILMDPIKSDYPNHCINGRCK